MTKAFDMEAPCNLKLLSSGGFVVGEAYDPFNSNPCVCVGGGGVLFNPFVSVQTLESVESFLLSRTEMILTS